MSRKKSAHRLKYFSRNLLPVYLISAAILASSLFLTLTRLQKRTLPEVKVESADTKIKTFQIYAENGNYSLKNLVAYTNDVIKIFLTAVDGSYDITFPDFATSQLAKAGETKILEFQAVSNGIFEYYCKSCTDNPDNIKGTLTVIKRP